MAIEIGTISGFIETVKAIVIEWEIGSRPWFRGEPLVEDTPLLPNLYRPLQGGKRYNENRIVQSFRRQGPGFADVKTPDIHAIDQWLFLMQHLRVPTRLLDWTEGALIGLYFALECANPVVWMLNPDQLNQLSVTERIIPGAFPLTWLRLPEGQINIGEENIRAAWEQNRRGLELPVAVKPTYIHPRMQAQKSCFTVHGRKQEPISRLVPSSVLTKFVVKDSAIASLRDDLVMLGITHTSIFPEAEFLAKDIREAAIKNAD